MEFTDREKLILHAGWILSIAPLVGISTKKAYKTISTVRKNICRKVTEIEEDEIINNIVEELKHVGEFLEFLRRGDIPGNA